MDLEAQIKLHKEISKKIEEMEEQKRTLSSSIMQQMSTKTLKIQGFTVRCCSRLNIKLTVEEARSFGAVKLEEVVDREKIKALYHNGHVIKGVSEIQYIQILEE